MNGKTELSELLLLPISERKLAEKVLQDKSCIHLMINTDFPIAGIMHVGHIHVEPRGFLHIIIVTVVMQQYAYCTGIPKSPGFS